MKKSILYRFLVITAAVLLVLTGCSTSQGSAADEVFNLRVLHINDSHSHVDPTTQDVEVPGYGTVRMELGGMTRISSLIGQYRGERENVLTLHAGDAIMGTTYFTFFNGDTEADVLNAMDFDAMAIGNHEFDLGDGFLADFISKLDFPVLSANIGTAPGNVLENSFEPYIIKEIGGQDVGIIGLTIAEKTRYSSSPSDEISFYDEGSSVQKSVDELKKMGIGKIIVLCHDTYDKSMGWASEVSDIDVIVSGDSHTLLGSELEAYGFAPEGDYPTMLTNRDGDPVYLVQAWEYAKALGVLDVTFTGDVVTAAQGMPVIPVSAPMLQDSGEKDDRGRPVFAEISAADVSGVKSALAGTSLVSVDEDPVVASVIKSYSDRKGDVELEVVAAVTEDLGHNRIPGDGRDGYRLALGSDIAPIVSKGFYEIIPNADLVIQNGGGVRVSIPAGDLTLKKCYELLPFSNTMFELRMTGAEIVTVLEDALHFALDENNTGSFPYAYGIRYDVDATEPAYQRISNVEIMDRKSRTWSDIDPEQFYVVITNDYIAGGKDGYLTFKAIQEERGPGYDTMTDYALSFIQYSRNLTAAGQSMSILPDEERSMKSYISQ